MKISIFTPTNNPEWIELPYNSIKHQLIEHPNLNVEWVIVPNNNIDIPSHIANEPWVKILRCSSNIKNIGGLKRFACTHATGDIFIELDHDDELLPLSLIKIKDSLKDGKDNAFIFSDTVSIKKDNKTPLYSSYYGWEHYTWQNYPINKTFKPNARTLCEIYYAPDHVRVWTRKAYELAGGHDESMLVGDDHDLVIRTYLAGSEFIQIEEPLYKYYIHGNNSWLQHNQAVQTQQTNNKEKYLRSLVKEWCRRENLPVIKLNDILYNNPKQNSVGCIDIDDTLTTVAHGIKAINTLNACYNALVPGGWALIDVPSTDGRGAWCDPTHVSFWNELSFRYYTNKQYAQFAPGINCKFQQVVLKTIMPSKWHEDNNVPYVRSDMCALKGQTHPGPNLFK